MGRKKERIVEDLGVKRVTAPPVPVKIPIITTIKPRVKQKGVKNIARWIVNYVENVQHVNFSPVLIQDTVIVRGTTIRSPLQIVRARRPVRPQARPLHFLLVIAPP